MPPLQPTDYMQAALRSGQPPQPKEPTPPGVDPAWSRMFGAATPATILEQRTAAGGVIPTPPGAAGPAPPGSRDPFIASKPFAPIGGAAPGPGKPAWNYSYNPALSPITTPQAAGMVNAMMPGAFNGNPNNGFSLTKQAGGQSNNERGGPPSSFGPGGTPDVMQAALAAMPKPYPAPAAPVGATPGVQPPRAAAGDVTAQARVAAEAPPPATGAVQAQAATAGPAYKSAEVSAPGQDGASTPTYSRNWNGKTWVTDAPFPKGFVNLSRAAQNAWLAKHEVKPPTTGGAPGGQPGDTTGGQPTGGGATQTPTPGPGDDTQLPDPTAEDDEAKYAIDADYRRLGPGFLNQTDDQIQNFFADWQSGGKSAWWGRELWTALLGENGAAKQPKLPHPNKVGEPYSEWIIGIDLPDYLTNPKSNRRIKEPGVSQLLATANEYARQLDYIARTQGTAGFNSQLFRQVSQKLYVATTGLEQYGIHYAPFNVSADPTTSRYDVGGASGGDTTGDTGAGRGPYETLTTVDVLPPRWGQGTPLGALLNIGSKDLAGEQRLAIAEYLAKLGLTEEGLRRNQQAINEAVSLRDKNAADPLVQKFLQGAQDYATDPPRTDWDTIRNQLVADKDALAENIASGLSTSSARRGPDAGAVQGIQTQMLGAQANDTARALGDLSIQRAAEERDLRREGLGFLQAGAGVSTGLRNMSSQQIQGLLMGKAPVVDNPFENVANVGMELHASQIALDQLDEAGEANWTDYLSAFGGLLKGAGGFMTGVGAL